MPDGLKMHNRLDGFRWVIWLVGAPELVGLDGLAILPGLDCSDG